MVTGDMFYNYIFYKKFFEIYRGYYKKSFEMYQNIIIK